MLNNSTNNIPLIDTGAERSVTGHFISGTVFSAIFAGSMNYSKYQKNEITKKEMIGDTYKMAIQGGVGTASAIATANYIGRGNYLGALSAISIGALGINGAQKLYEKIDYNEKPKLIEEKIDEQ
ncbi:MAG: hypothetical protein U9P72_03920 [Campylobacterota bacterium]|nr:hypothetical protein [Campylobacterota bacterium]